jgi:hypothetical protein
MDARPNARREQMVNKPGCIGAPKPNFRQDRYLLILLPAPKTGVSGISRAASRAAFINGNGVRLSLTLVVADMLRVAY